MKQHKLSESDIIEFKELFESSEELAIELINDQIYKERYLKVGRIYNRMSNYFLMNELYISDEASDITRELLNNLNSYYTLLDPNTVGKDKSQEKIEKIRNILPDLRKQFKIICKQDLRKSFSD